MGLSVLWQRPLPDFCKHSKETLGFTKCKKKIYVAVEKRQMFKDDPKAMDLDMRTHVTIFCETFLHVRNSQHQITLWT
jgi:hypothetical protein